MTWSEAGIPAAAVRAQLERIIGSPAFERSERLSQFLRYTVEQVLAGRGDLLKEYTIALEVFGRPPSFDPRVDSVVRVAARSVRAKLVEFYETLGRTDVLLIDLPKGGYVPTFQQRDHLPLDASAPAASGRHRASRWRLAWAGALLLTGAAAALWFTVGPGSRPRTMTVAVLPFDSVNQAPEDSAFSEGLVDELTTRLAKVEGFRVMAGTSSRLLKAARDPIEEARKYHVDALVEGSVARAGGMVRISARVTSTENRYQLWSESYDRDTRDSFLLQDEIAYRVSRALQAKVRPAGEPAPSRRLDPEAVRLYWMGRSVRRQARPDSMTRSAELFSEAVRMDPGYADAWAALADVYAVMAYHQTSGSSPEEQIRRSREAAARALALDPASVEALVARAFVQSYFERNWGAAERGFREALRLNPSDSKTRQRFGTALMSRGRFDEAIEQSRQSIVLDPLSVGISNDLGVVLYVAGRCDEAMRGAREALAADPSFAPAHALLGCCHSSAGRWNEAIAEFERAVSLTERFSYLIGHLGYNHGRAGHGAEARALLKELTESPDQGSVSYVHVAYILAGLGERARAIDALERAVARHDADVVYMGVDPTLDPLRGDPRFLALLERAGLVNVRRPR